MQEAITKQEHNSRFSIASILIFLYCLQGLVIGLFLDTMQVILKSKLSYVEVGTFLLCSYPFSLKIIWSPLVDSYYNKKIGLRKTWIIPTQFFSGVMLFILGTKIDSYLETNKVFEMSILAFAIMFLVATQDIAVDGWGLSLCGKENCTLASSCQTIGHVLGMCFSTTVYVNLHAYDLISLSTYIKIVSFVFFIATSIIFFIHEKDYRESGDEEEPTGLIDTFKKLKIVFTNKNVLSFIGLLLFTKIGNVFSNSILDLVLIDNGLTPKAYSNICTIFIPIRIIMSYYFSDIKGNYLRLFSLSYKRFIYLFIGEYIYMFVFLYFSTQENVSFVFIWNSFLRYVLIISLWITKCYIGHMNFASLNGFFNKIIDKEIGATYITMLNSFNNLSEKWPGIFVFYLVDLIGYKLIGILSILYCIGYYMVSKSVFYRLDDLDESEWKIKRKEKKN